MNSTTGVDKGPIFIATGPIFDSDDEARTAFERGRLPWCQNETGYTFKVKKGKVVGHSLVVVADISGIDEAGAPVYVCQLNDGTLMYINSDMLLTKQKMLWLPDGKPTAYQEWIVGEMQVQNAQRMKILRNPPPVTVLLTWDGKNS